MLCHEIYFFEEGGLKSGVSLAFFHADFKSGIIYLKKLTNFMLLSFFCYRKFNFESINHQTRPKYMYLSLNLILNH